tara:strand:+ start:2916 stop:3164 length:249 start_codon:yes stop_codon:yes gene_type:complete
MENKKSITLDGLGKFLTKALDKIHSEDIEKLEEKVTMLEKKNKMPPVGNGHFSKFADWSEDDQVMYNDLLEKIHILNTLNRM